MDKMKQWLYYIIIGVISFITLVFLPMVGSEIGLKWQLPDTTVGWIVFVAVKVIVSVINVLLFHCFMQQAKLNVMNNPRYIEANEILRRQKKKEVLPRGPRKWNAQQYSHKAITLFIATSLSTVALTQAVLTFDYMAMLVYLFSIIMGIIFGVMQMKVAEEYWTNEYYEYAMLQKQQQEEEQEKVEQVEEQVKEEEGELKDDNNQQ